MENLVGHPDRDRIIEEELRMCRIEPVRLERPNGREVNASVEGKLGNLRFVRGWYYWIVDGPVSLSVAQRLYEDPLGKRDVRVNGHCGRPAPNKTVDCYQGGRYDASNVPRPPSSASTSRRSMMALDNFGFANGWTYDHLYTACGGNLVRTVSELSTSSRALQ